METEVSRLLMESLCYKPRSKNQAQIYLSKCNKGDKLVCLFDGMYLGNSIKKSINEFGLINDELIFDKLKNYKVLIF